MRVSLPEQVWIDFEPASFGSRSLAFIIDFVIRWTFVVLCLLGLVFLSSLLEGSTLASTFRVIADLFESSSTLLLALLVIFVFAIEWCYPIYFDLRHEGVTPGKRVMGLRVVDERGLSVTFSASLLRTIVRLVDLLPGMGLVAFFSMLVTKKSQRLGDLVARTLVIHESKHRSFGVEPGAHSDYTVERTLPLSVYNVVGKYLRRRDELSPEARQMTLDKVIDAVLNSTSRLERPRERDLNTGESWLEQVYRTSKPERQSEAKSVKEHAVDWAGIDAELKRVSEQFELLQENGRSLDAEKLSRIGLSYQQLCQLYAYLSTFYPESGPARRAAQLVRTGRRMIYSNRLSVFNRPKETFLKRVSMSFHCVRVYCLVAGLFAVSSGVIAALLIQINPEMSWYFLSEEAAERLSQGHIWTDQIQGLSSFSSSRIMTNNIQVTFIAFAMGITAGIGTVLILIINGALLGGIFSALSYYDMAMRLFDFVVGHGFLEISVIIVAAGCGLYLGDAILHPGSRTRKRALQDHGRVVVELIIFNVVCLVVAGIVEGYISPYPIPFLIKLLLGVLLGVIYWQLLVFGRLPRIEKVFSTTPGS